MTRGDYTKEALSPKGHDNKEYTRMRALEIVSNSCLLWDTANKHLVYSWMELAGPGAPTLQMLLDHEALSPNSLFYGVDIDPKVIAACRKQYAEVPQARWIEADLSCIVARHTDVGVLVFDSHNGVVGDDFEESLEMLNIVAKAQAERLGEFLLVINASSSRRSREEVDSYPALLTKHFRMPVQASHIHKYVSKKTPMHWVALRWGF